MKILDIDMDYFLMEVPTGIQENSRSRISDEDYPVWTREDVVEFLEKRLGLSKDKRIKGKIITHHNEALYYWRELVNCKKLSVPCEVIHIDSHADLGLGGSAWTFIMDSLLQLPVEERSNIESYSNIFDKYYMPGIGDYLLFALAFRWISKLTYICNPKELGDDYVWAILKDGIEPNDKIQLTHNENMKATDALSSAKSEMYYKTATREPEVDFDIIRQIEDINYNGEFDFITFCISPNYTPASADFIVEIIKEYIEEK